MASINLDMNDIFETEDGDGNEDNFPSALPDLPEELAPLDNDEDHIPPTQDENAEVLAKLKGMKGGKKVIRRPQPKLDGARLTGERGIPILPGVFKDIKFKGHGHEAEDLQVTMKYLEHWAHRLFPKMPFDECLERIEKLGSKKEVQTCIKKMRLDIPILNEDFVEEKDENPPTPPRRGDFDGEDAFDAIMREEQEQRLQSQQTPVPKRTDTPSTPVIPAQTPIPTPVATPGITVPNGLTPELREKIERNKRLAMEKRAARLAAQQTPGSANPAAGTSTTAASATPDRVPTSQTEELEPMDTTDTTEAAERKQTNDEPLSQTNENSVPEISENSVTETSDNTQSQTSHDPRPEAEGPEKTDTMDTASQPSPPADDAQLKGRSQSEKEGGVQTNPVSSAEESFELNLTTDSAEHTEVKEQKDDSESFELKLTIDTAEQTEVKEQLDVSESFKLRLTIDTAEKTEETERDVSECENNPSQGESASKDCEDKSVDINSGGDSCVETEETMPVNRYTETEQFDKTGTTATGDNSRSTGNETEESSKPETLPLNAEESLS